MKDFPRTVAVAELGGMRDNHHGREQESEKREGVARLPGFLAESGPRLLLL
jgi:hypothetical protein